MRELKHKIIETRDSAITEAQREYKVSLSHAADTKDAATREKMMRNADEAYRYAMRNIAADAHSALVARKK